MKLLPNNPIRWTAVICVAITSGYIMWLGNKQLNILSSPEWCSKALQAERISAQNFGGLTACTDLLMIQLNAIARGFLVSNGVIALCLLALIVIVIAGGQIDLSGLGGSLHLGRKGEATPAAKAATDTAAAAVNEAANIVSNEGGVTPAPGENG
jgi:hypothetical protein